MTRPDRRRWNLAAGAAFALLMALAVPVSAAQLDGGTYFDVETSSETLCGVDWDVETTSSGRFMLKRGHGGDPTPYYFDIGDYRIVYTDPTDASRGFVISGSVLFRDVHITLVSGTTYRFDTIEVGRTMVLSTLDGRAIAHDAGQRLWTFIIDTHGSSDLADFEILDLTISAGGGRHSLADADEAELCALVGDILGS